MKKDKTGCQECGELIGTYSKVFDKYLCSICRRKLRWLEREYKQIIKNHEEVIKSKIKILKMYDRRFDRKRKAPAQKNKQS